MNIEDKQVNELQGQNLGGYLLEEEIGYGSMGVVYRGKQIALGREVAIKVLPKTLAHDSSYVARFIREAQIIAGLNHPNIVQIYDAGQQNKQLYLVMEYVQGPTLSNLLRLDGTIPQRLAVEYASQIADALDAAYQERHVIHRDIKPENLILNRWGKIKVIDFGLAHATGYQKITVAKSLVRSLYYASPEQVWGENLDNRSDIYALGVVLYEMVTGRRPFTGRSLPELTQAIIGGNPQPPRFHKPALSPELEYIILTALSLDRNERYPNAAVLAQKLRALRLTSQDKIPLPLQSEKALVKIQETADANTELNEQWELIRPFSAENVYELSPSTQQTSSSSHGNQQTNQEHQIVLYSVARATLEKKDSALVGKVYKVQAGISQGELKDFQSEAFDLLVNSAHTSIAFDISLHTSENLELTTPWQQFLRYTIQNQEPQLVEFAFRALLPGESTLIFDFYHEQHLLKTMRLEFMVINQTSIPARSTRGNV